MSADDELVEILKEVGVDPEYVRKNDSLYFQLLHDSQPEFGGLDKVPYQEAYFRVFPPGTIPLDAMHRLFHLEGADLVYRLPKSEGDRKKELLDGLPTEDMSRLHITDKGKQLYQTRSREFSKLVGGDEGLDQFGPREV